MIPSVKLARRLYAAIKALDDAHEREGSLDMSDETDAASYKSGIEQAEDRLTDVLCDLKQWSAAP